MDLKQRGMLEETLIVWSGEFGRTPMNEKRNNQDTNLGQVDHLYLLYAVVKRIHLYEVVKESEYRECTSNANHRA